MTSATPLPPSFMEHQGLLRFTVDVDNRQVSAFLSDDVWQARYSYSYSNSYSNSNSNSNSNSVSVSVSDASLTERYRNNRSLIDAAVVRRVQSGARHPVVLRPSDL